MVGCFVNGFFFVLSHFKKDPTQKRTGAVGSTSDFRPRGPQFDPRQGRRLLWP